MIAAIYARMGSERTSAGATAFGILVLAIRPRETR